MKKIFSAVILGLAVVFSACGTGNDPEPVNEVPFTIQIENAEGNWVEATDGMTITVSELNELTGQMTFDGKIIKSDADDDDFTMNVDVERILIDGATDELCLSQCVPGNGEATQTFTDVISKTETEFYAHMTPANAVVYKVNYFFHVEGKEKGIMLHVEYDATALAGL